MSNDLLFNKLKLIPHLPGCYLWKNANNEVIYVGKAKDLFNRTHQYFDKSKTYKMMALVNDIYDIDYFIVKNSNEALILENNLIKKYLPKYNTLLKDSSEYPYIVVTNTKIPKIIYTRKYHAYKGKYYGPLADSKFNRYELYKFLLEIAPLKQEGILKNEKGLFYDIYLENDPTITEDEVFKKWRLFIDNLFHGKSKEIINAIKQLEVSAVDRLDFEHAEKYKNLIESIKNLTSSQIVQLTKKDHIDYFCYYQEDENIVFNVFNYINGKLISKHNSIHKIYDQFNDVVESVVNQYYSNNLPPKHVVISLPQENLQNLSTNFNIKFSAPLSKTNQEIMMIGIANAKTYLNNHKLTIDKKLSLANLASEELAKLLNIKSANYIEAFDNSNINLQHAVSGMVVFKNGQAFKSGYRKYKLNEDNLKSDFHYMQEVIYRRYSRLLEMKQQLPDLIIVDGGQIQVKAALISLEKLNLKGKVPVIGLKKDNNHKTNVIVLENNEEIKVDHKSNVFLFLTNIQDEVHKFAISFYRQKHLTAEFKLFLDDIPGVGKKTKIKLLNNYPTINELRNVSTQELEQIVPNKVAIAIKEKLNEN